MDTRRTSPCDRQSDLLSYLYGEAAEVERRGFEQHLGTCSSCRDELEGFSRVRDTLGQWNLGFNLAGPRVDISIKRNSIETLRDAFAVFAAWPAWMRFAGATTMAALVLLASLALAGTRIDLDRRTISFGVRGRTAPSVQVEQGSQGTEKIQLTRAEIETMISERLAKVSADNLKQEEVLRAQIAGLSAKLASAGQSQKSLEASLATLRAEQRALAARGQSTLGEWLFAANDSRVWGGDDEKD